MKTRNDYARAFNKNLFSICDLMIEALDDKGLSKKDSALLEMYVFEQLKIFTGETNAKKAIQKLAKKNTNTVYVKAKEGEK